MALQLQGNYAGASIRKDGSIEVGFTHIRDTKNKVVYMESHVESNEVLEPREDPHVIGQLYVSKSIFPDGAAPQHLMIVISEM